MSMIAKQLEACLSKQSVLSFLEQFTNFCNYLIRVNYEDNSDENDWQQTFLRAHSTCTQAEDCDEHQ